jgi:hypothetical protein
MLDDGEFLDHYLQVRLYVSVFATILVAALALTGWWQSASPILNLLASHAVHSCRCQGAALVRRPLP